MLPPRFLVSQVTLWNSDGVQENMDIVVSDGKIEAIGPHGSFSENVDVFEGEGRVLMPAGVDLQVHLRVPGQPEKELPLTGLRAALRGGVGAILTMPNTKPVIDNLAALELGKKEVKEAERVTGVKVLWSAAMTKTQHGVELVDGEVLKKSGVVALTDDGVGVSRDEIMEKVFAAAEKHGLPLLQHAEVPGHGAALAPGKTQVHLGLKPYPAEVEWKMVERDLNLLRLHPKARYHVLHVSSAKTLELVKKAKSEGLHATCEATPHHLFFNSDGIPSGNTHFKMNPPIRSESDRTALIEALANGECDFVTTDHAPHEPGRKGNDFASSAFGTTGLETSLNVLLDLYLKKKLTAERVVQVFSSKPAEFIGVEKTYGTLKKGMPFNAILVDMKTKKRIQESDLESLSKNNCFLGYELPGKVVAHFTPAGTFRF